MFKGRIVVYRYRCPADAARHVPDVAMDQMHLAHKLRNQLVEVERRHGEQVAAVWAAHPEVAKALEDVDARDGDVQALVKRAREQRMADRSRVPRGELQDAMKAAKAELRAARQHLKAVRQEAYAVVRPAMADAQSTRRAQITAAGHDAKAEGLLWHTHDAVLAQHDTAVQRVAALRKSGKPAELRFHRWDGSGRLRVTLMRSEFRHGCDASKPPWPCGQPSPRDCPERVTHHPTRSPALLTSGSGPWANVIQFPPHMDPEVCETDPPRRHGARESIRLRVGSVDGKPVWWELPMFVHRPVPADGDVTFVEVKRERIAGNWRLSVCVTVRLPAVPTRTQGHLIGIDVGWRSVEGGIRTATLVSSAGRFPTIPAELGEVLRPLSDAAVEVVVPDSWRDVWMHTTSVRSIRDQSLDALRRKVVDALNEGEVAGIETSAVHVERWRSPRRFAMLAWAWPQDHPLKDTLMAWRRQDKHLWEIEAHERDQIVARRRDAWRKVAAWMLADNVLAVAIEDISIAELAQVPAVEDGDDQQAVLARAQHQVAAPAELLSTIRMSAGQRGVVMHKVDPAGTSRVHSVCGTELQDASAFAHSVVVWCPICEIGFDQDVNAARNMITRTTGDLPAGPGESSA
jgi:hypothetical protein